MPVAKHTIGAAGSITGASCTAPRRRVVAAASVALALAACAEMEAKDRASSLETSSNAYAAALRWGRYQEAARFRLPRSGPVTMPDVEPLEHIKLTSYEVMDQTLNADATEARMEVVIHYYHDDVGRVDTLKQSQVWWYEPTQKHWFLETDLPPFLRHYTRRR
ncbi:MAG: hypothetical protein ACREXW_14765 [Gammaproteobacteria bacterium]